MIFVQRCHIIAWPQRPLQPYPAGFTSFHELELELKLWIESRQLEIAIWDEPPTRYTFCAASSTQTPLIRRFRYQTQAKPGPTLNIFGIRCSLMSIEPPLLLLGMRGSCFCRKKPHAKKLGSFDQPA